MSRRRWLVVGIGGAAVLLLLGRMWADIYADYLWHLALGSVEVWRAQLTMGAVLTLGSALVAALFAFVNLLVVRHSVISLVLPRRVANVEFGEEIPGHVLSRTALLGGAVVGIVMALPSSGWWNLLLAVEGVSFGETDPYFQKDLGFYVSRLPLEDSLYTWAVITCGVVGIVVVILYALTPSLRWRKGGIVATSYVRRHITILGGLLLLLLAWSFRIRSYEMLATGSGPDGAFGYVDHTIGIPGNLALAVAAIIAGLIVTWAGWSGQTRLAVLGITAVLVLAVFVRILAPAAAHRFADAEVREARERPYLATRASYTRRAFGADRITQSSDPFAASLAAAAPGVPAWDPLAAANALRFTDPTSAANRAGWIAEAGMLELVLAESLATREALEGHRWKVARVAAAFSDAGAPLLRGAAGGSVAHTLPTVVSDIDRGHMVVSSAEGRVAGVPLAGRARRMALAWSLRDVDLLLERFPGADPVVVSRRRIEDRVRRVAPPFEQYGDASVTVVADTLFWIVPLYSAAASLPLSRHIEIGGGQVNWLRHSVTAIVNGSTGRIRLVADSASDPLAMMWRARFPSLFVPWGGIEPALRRSVPPSRIGARATAIAYARYGARDERLGRGGHVPPWNGADSLLAGERMIVTTGVDDRTMTIFPVLAEDDVVVGFVAAYGGGEGQISWRPVSGSFAWPEIARRLAEASTDTADQAPFATRGGIRVIPLEDGLAYLQPEYRWPDGGTALLREVALLAGGTVRAGPSLPGLTGVEITERRRATEEWGDVALRLYERMRAALGRGDWASFGNALDSLGMVLERGRR